MKTSIKSIAIAAIVGLLSLGMSAQQDTKPKKVMVHIVTDENGKTNTFEATELTPEAEQKLKEAGINISELKNGSVVTINRTTSSSTTSTNDNGTTIKTININGGNETELGNDLKTYSFTSDDSNVKVIVNGEELTSSHSDSKDKKVKMVFVMVNLTNSSAEERKKAGINDTKESLEINEVLCMPNPTNGKFKISFKSENKSNVELLVRDINGKIVLKEQAANNNGEFSKEIDLGNEAKGIYFVTINQGGKATTKKLVVN
jgi:hypothetical protein